MKIYNSESNSLSEMICSGDYDVAIFLSKKEAEELRGLIAHATATLSVYKGLFKDAPFYSKLDLGLEMLGIKRKRK